MIWTRHTTTLPRTATWFGAGVMAALSFGPGNPPITGTASGASGPSIAVITGHVAHHGGVPRGTSPFERRRATRSEPIDAMLSLAQAGPQVRIAGRVVLPNRGMVDIGARRRFARGRGTVDDRPVLEEEAFLLGLLLGEDD